MKRYETVEGKSRLKEIVEMAKDAKTIYLASGINEKAKANLLSRLCYE
jgi:copper homeostasis protein CutC